MNKIKKYGVYIIACITIVVIGLLASRTNQAKTNHQTSFHNQQQVAQQIEYIYIDIKGAVQHPGVYQLQPNSRLFQAISKAGGSRVDADIEAINLSMILIDQQVVYIPFTYENYPKYHEQVTQDKININTADINQLSSLTGIGASTAQSIIDYRTQNGLFSTIEEIMNVSGIGEATFAKIKNDITTS